jgi:GDP/UDP-N,N'-diacetylbacillosamine 2-epimerase (hydrolysing)
MGEEPWRIHQVGAPQLDQLVQTDFDSIENLGLAKLSLVKDKYVIVCFHSSTEQIEESFVFARELLGRFEKNDLEVLWILPNNDPGSLQISQLIKGNRNKRIKCFSNLTREEYLIALKNSLAIIGNSSSGVLEAPTFKIPALNLGIRQINRTRSSNVIDCFNIQELDFSLDKLLSPVFKESLSNISNPYGDGESVSRILEVLLGLNLNEKNLTVKGMTY